ncbi:hypothetical protein FACS1894182_01040 [Bacteroidia bacterium]|nr:hypothetical protein FACS1894182_01040 [Bacteroidia bacterium]
MFITEKTSEGEMKGFDIESQPLFRLRYYGMIIGILAIFASIVWVGVEIAFLPILILIISIGLFVGLFFITNSDSKEKYVREQFYKTIGCSIMPEWLFEYEFNNFYQAMQEKYTQHFGDYNTLYLVIKDFHPNVDGFALLFCLSYMDNVKDGKKIANKALVENYKEYWSKK